MHRGAEAAVGRQVALKHAVGTHTGGIGASFLTEHIEAADGRLFDPLAIVTKLMLRGKCTEDKV